ncbi:IS701 family transposase [Deinococcus sonorensis]|uniref:IS701 family transposase n=2 Tax=Deinococcus sonorensis TaxID=309891 RepID=A0AAU7UGI4_9DEIO
MRRFKRFRQLFPAFFAPFLAGFRHTAQRRLAPLYVQGLCSFVARKSITPLAQTVAPGQGDHLQHFITDSPWDPQPLETLVAQQAQRLVGGKDAVLIIDDTCLTKFGTKSVGVSRQYSGQVGKVTNCQCLVSLTLAQHDVPIPLALRLFLPSEWTGDVERCERAGVPAAHLVPKAKWEIALEELDRVRRSVTFGVVLADAAYGNNAEFRKALSKRGLFWSVGIVRNQKVYSEDVRLIPPPRIVRGRRPKGPSASEERQTVEALLQAAPWHEITWRHGTKGPMRGRFAAVFVRIADGAANGAGAHLPGEELWVIGEERNNGGCKYYACNFGPAATLNDLVAVTKRRWACEHGHRELKQEVGLSHFEGRSWRGLHHHAVLCLVALAFLQAIRLEQPDGVQGETLPAIRAELAGTLSQPLLCPRCRLLTVQPAGP